MSVASDHPELMLNVLEKQPSPDAGELARALGVWEGDMRHGVQVLTRSNEHLRAQAVTLQRRNEELEAFAHTVAHDLKDPLAALVVTASAITDISDLTPQELRDYMRQICTTAYEMNEIIENLLLLSEVTKKAAPRQTVDMADLMPRLRRRLGSMLKEYHGRIHSPKRWPVAQGYAPWIEEVWANYISNALKYGGRPPEIRLGCTPEPDGRLRFWVRDNGAGIAPRDQARLFLPYSRVGRPRQRGHGLGLSIVRRILEKLGGQVGVESRPGRGSQFYFILSPAEELPGPDGRTVPPRAANHRMDLG